MSDITKPILYKNSDLNKNAFNVLFEMKNKNELCDIIIVVKSEIINAHKCILAASSPYFFGSYFRFNGKLVSKNVDEIQMNDFDPIIVKSIIDYLYTGEILINNENAKPLLELSDYFCLTEVVEECFTFLKNSINEENCFEMKNYAEMHNFTKLLNNFTDYILENIENISKTENFLKLTVEKVIELISHNDLNVEKEKIVWKIALNWIKKDVKERKENLLKCVRLPLINKVLLEKIALKEPLVYENKQCLQRIKEVLNDDDETIRTKMMRNEQKYLFATGGWNHEGSNDVCEAYNPKKRKWFKMAPMFTSRFGHASIGLNRRVYVTGGNDEATYLSSSECYDPKLNKWREFASMLNKRRNFALCSINSTEEEFYAVGGCKYKSMEMYSVSRDKWYQCPKMNHIQHNCHATQFENSIYAMGFSEHFERYDPREKKWHVITTNLPERFFYDLTTCKSHIYRIGGRDYDNDKIVNICKRFDARTNTWETLRPMNHARFELTLVTIDNLIYAIGGTGDIGENNVVECYDTESNHWETLEPLQVPRSSLGSATVGVRNLNIQFK